MSIFETLADCGCNKPDCYFCWLRGRAYTTTAIEKKREIPELSEILSVVSEAAGVTVEQIVGESRQENICIARQVFCYAARQQKTWKDRQIGAAINKDRTTVVHSFGVVKTMLEIGIPPEYTALCNKLGIAL